jgi:hypothetical protein
MKCQRVYQKFNSKLIVNICIYFNLNNFDHKLGSTNKFVTSDMSK